ncbi:MAG: glycosyltransferase family 2 protein [Gemmatimonadota bacterium]|nr:MAG: glycosyltransferase family 2 protein [Gemmatimonadota bacterium]
MNISNHKMIVTVIICTYDRSHLLRRALSSLVHQTLKPDQFEIIVVDDGSRDETPTVCEMLRKKLPHLRYISTGSNLGLAHARNVGIKAASGNYIIFTDDDCIPATDWLERLCADLDRAPIVAGAVTSPVNNYMKLCHNISSFHAYMPGRKSNTTPFIAGANMGFHRRVLEELRGFQNSLRIAQDIELILRARHSGLKILFSPNAIVLHDPERTTVASIFRHTFKHAAVTISLRNRYRSLLRTPFILRSAPLLLLLAPLIALKVTFQIYLSNVNIAKLFWTAPLVYMLKITWCLGAYRGLRSGRGLKKE